MRDHSPQEIKSRTSSGNDEPKVAIIGGGPGGMFTAWHLANKLGTACKITIYEASDRLGGKLVTGQFAGVGTYEIGVAEIYDYSHLGPDPLRTLIESDLGLDLAPISGGSCILDGKIIHDINDLARHFGSRVRDEVLAFRQKGIDTINASEYYQARRTFDNRHPWARMTAEELLNREVHDDIARRFLRIMAHSDVAAPPHLTNGLSFLKNLLMDVDEYFNVVSIIGGNEQIVERLRGLITAEIRLGAPVKSVTPLFDGRFQIGIGANGHSEVAIADYVVVAVPLTALSIIDWRSPQLQHAMAEHIHYFDRPGHYLRATLLFERPFWREHVGGAWWMMDAFDGCCVYDEGARNSLGQWGALGFLITGNAALNLVNLSDDEITQLCLDSLPGELSKGRHLLADRRVHRWMASVNAIPGGYPVRSPYQNHRPLAKQLPGFLVVGDYMFDATINGALDSADAATDVLLSEVLARRRATAPVARVPNGAWFSHPIDEGRQGTLSGPYLAPMLDFSFGLKRGERILHFGSGSGRLVSELRAQGFDAYGIEPCRAAYNTTPEDIRAFNRTGPADSLDFPEGHFDVVLDTGLCRLEPARVAGALAEVRRVTRRGLIFASVTNDLPMELIERHKLLLGVKTLGSRWIWADLLQQLGFAFAFEDPVKLDVAWRKAVAAGVAPSDWYEDPETLSYGFYEIRGTSARDDLAAQADVERIIREHLYGDERVPEKPRLISSSARPS